MKTEEQLKDIRSELLSNVETEVDALFTEGALWVLKYALDEVTKESYNQCQARAVDNFFNHIYGGVSERNYKEAQKHEVEYLMRIILESTKVERLDTIVKEISYLTKLMEDCPSDSMRYEGLRDKKLVLLCKLDEYVEYIWRNK